MLKILPLLILIIFSHSVYAEVTSSNIKKHLIGNWIRIVDESYIKLESRSIYYEDKRFAYQVVFTYPEKRPTLTLSGTYEIKDNALIATILKTNSPDRYIPGTKIIMKVSFIDDSEFIYAEKSGETITKYREFWPSWPPP